MNGAALAPAATTIAANSQSQTCKVHDFKNVHVVSRKELPEQKLNRDAHGQTRRAMTRRFELYVSVTRHSIAMAGKFRTRKEEIMVRAYLTSAVAGALLLGMATAALAVTGEYGNMCTMGLALGKDIQTDCSINAQVQRQNLLLR